MSFKSYDRLSPEGKVVFGPRSRLDKDDSTLLSNRDEASMAEKYGVSKPFIIRICWIKK